MTSSSWMDRSGLVPSDRLRRRNTQARGLLHGSSAKESRGVPDGLASALRARIRGDVLFDAPSRGLYAQDASNYFEVPIGVVLPSLRELRRQNRPFGSGALPENSTPRLRIQSRRPLARRER